MNPVKVCGAYIEVITQKILIAASHRTASGIATRY